MNGWLDRGLVCMFWVACMWVADSFLGNTGVTSYAALMIGASSMALVGLIILAFRKMQKG